MIHDEKTTELELPVKGNILVLPTSQAPLAKPAAAIGTPKETSWYKDFDLGAPWVLRLVAVVAITILCMIVL